MERLTRRHSDGSVGISQFRYYNYDDCQKMMQKLAAYEDAEEQGLLLRFPVAEGTPVYTLEYFYDCKFDYQCPFDLNERDICVLDMPCKNEYKVWRINEVPFYFKMLENVGKTVFLTKVEAEKALAELQSK